MEEEAPQLDAIDDDELPWSRRGRLNHEHFDELEGGRLVAQEPVDLRLREGKESGVCPPAPELPKETRARLLGP